jgi:DNA-directed RNA polymerase specialized sigma24 family protein
VSGDVIEANTLRSPSNTVADALAQLSETDHEILQLSAWEDLPVPSIAQVLGCSTAAAAVRLHRARRRLAAVLGPSFPDPTHHPNVVDLTMKPAAISRSMLSPDPA